MPPAAPASAPVVIPLLAALVALVAAVAVEWSRRRGARRTNEWVAEQGRELEQLKHELATRQATAADARQADELMATYRNPLARSVQDLQSRLWNMHRGFRGGRDPEYYRMSTLYVVAECLGWLEIVRQEIQFLDAGEQTARVRAEAARLQDRFASTSRRYSGDPFYLYRAEQRAIGELMIVPRETGPRPGPSRQCLGYAAFTTRLDDAAFAAWFERFGRALVDLERDATPRRLVDIQHAAVDLLDVLDPDQVRNPQPRSKVEGAR